MESSAALVLVRVVLVALRARSEPRSGILTSWAHARLLGEAGERSAISVMFLVVAVISAVSGHKVHKRRRVAVVLAGTAFAIALVIIGIDFAFIAMVHYVLLLGVGVPFLLLLLARGPGASCLNAQLPCVYGPGAPRLQKFGNFSSIWSNSFLAVEAGSFANIPPPPFCEPVTDQMSSLVLTSYKLKEIWTSVSVATGKCAGPFSHLMMPPLRRYSAWTADANCSKNTRLSWRGTTTRAALIRSATVSGASTSRSRQLVPKMAWRESVATRAIDGSANSRLRIATVALLGTGARKLATYRGAGAACLEEHDSRSGDEDQAFHCELLRKGDGHVTWSLQNRSQGVRRDTLVEKSTTAHTEPPNARLKLTAPVIRGRIAFVNTHSGAAA